MRDLTANLLTEVCHDVCVEPRLQPLSGETLSTRSATTEDNARLDVAASGFWGGRFEGAFFDVRGFNPYVPSNRAPPTATCYRRHEREKRRKYEERILEVEHASFVPLVMSCTGGAGPCATIFFKRLECLVCASCMASHCHFTVRVAMNLICDVRLVHNTTVQTVKLCQVHTSCSHTALYITLSLTLSHCTTLQHTLLILLFGVSSSLSATSPKSPPDQSARLHCSSPDLHTTSPQCCLRCWGTLTCRTSQK